MNMLIDDRESTSRVQMIMENDEIDIPIEVRRLNYGDILIKDGNIEVAIEVKTYSDYCQSCRNRRIQSEALNMTENCNYSIIILYDDGKFNPKFQKPLTFAEDWGNTMSLCLVYSVPFIRCKNENEFLYCLIGIINNIKKINKPINKPIVRNKDSNPFVNVLIGIDGVGKQTANKLLKHFKKPSAVLNATEEELDKVPRLSKKAKKNILRL